jgi:hypothetical protein
MQLTNALGRNCEKAGYPNPKPRSFKDTKRPCPMTRWSRGLPQRAPDGYINKERQVSSNKYERWVERDPTFTPVRETIWELLLTDRYALKEICEELSQRGLARSSGRPWAWRDPRSGARRWADNRLHRIFHNPFYACVILFCAIALVFFTWAVATRATLFLTLLPIVQ